MVDASDVFAARTGLGDHKRQFNEHRPRQNPRPAFAKTMIRGVDRLGCCSQAAHRVLGCTRLAATRAPARTSGRRHAALIDSNGSINATAPLRRRLVNSAWPADDDSGALRDPLSARSCDRWRVHDWPAIYFSAIRTSAARNTFCGLRPTCTWTTIDKAITYDAASDGCFPLITNTRDLPETDVLVAYRYQPNLERRHHLLKSVQDADPIWLRDPARIEAIFCCQFLALLVGALIERQIRVAMRVAKTRDIPLYPELRACEAPSAERILTVFADLTRHELHHDGHLVQTFEPELTPPQQQILDLLGVPATAYAAN
jgi:hypothetical protein